MPIGAIVNESAGPPGRYKGMGAYGVKLTRRPALTLHPDPRAPAWEDWTAWASAQTRPIAVDLFAGGGGLSLGLENAGFLVGLAVDHDTWSVRTHAANFRGMSVQMDLSDPEQEKRLTELLGRSEIALIAGGPPCQPFSRAGRSGIRHLVEQGRRAAYDDRRDLWRVWLRVVLAARPRAVLLENVPDMALGDDMTVIRMIVEELQDAGYETHMDIVEAPEHGVPQHRQRLILVAMREAPRPFQWPEPTDRVSIWDAIGDLPLLGDGFGAEVMPYRKRRRTPFQERARAGVRVQDGGVVHDHVTRPVRDDDRQAFRLMGPSTRYSDLPAELRRYRADTFDDKYKRHGKDELSRSITAHIAKDGYWYIHPVEERTLTVREAARLQTFPDWYRFAGHRSDAYRQIGNAVPPLLAERIGRAILTAFEPARSPATVARRAGLVGSVPRHFPTVLLRQARDRLDAWAARDAQGAPWRHHTEPWPALVSSVLMNARADDGTVGMLLLRMPDPDGLAAVLADPNLGLSVRRALTRLVPGAEAWSAGQGSDGGQNGWWDAVRLLPAEAERFACLAFGAQVLMTTQAPMRVAARVTGRAVDKVDRLTDGRFALAEIIGGGPRAAGRMAAVAALGRDVCTLDEPECSTCPLSVLCRSAAS